MAMGIVSNEEFENELKINGNTKVVSEDNKERGRKEGDNNVPDSLRKIIGEESVINGRKDALALARMFGISDSSVSAYAKGATSTDSYNKPNNGIVNYLNNRKERLTKRALLKLGSALHHITPERLANVKTKDLASIAKDMSAIVKNMEPQVKSGDIGNQQNNQFIFYAPKFMQEKDYEVINAQE